MLKGQLLLHLHVTTLPSKIRQSRHADYGSLLGLLLLLIFLRVKLLMRSLGVRYRPNRTSPLRR
jgi:hypothetical protein